MEVSKVIIDDSFYNYFRRYGESDESGLYFKSRGDSFVSPHVYIGDISIISTFNMICINEDFILLFTRDSSYDSHINDFCIDLSKQEKQIELSVKFVDEDPCLCMNTVNVKSSKYTM